MTTESDPLEIGAPAPDFTLPGTQGVFSLRAQRGKQVVLYFYPRDATPGCTTEAEMFRDQYEAFAAANAIIVGVSRDSLGSHKKFAEKHGLPFTLLADPQEAVCTQYRVMKEKMLYGKKVRGIERSTFHIDPTGTLRQSWRGVKVAGHVEAVLAALQTL